MQILERYLGSNVASDIVKIYYGTEQVYPLGVNVIAGSGDLTITAFVPSMGVEIPLNVNDLTFEGFAGVGEISSFSGLGGVTLQGFAAALGVDINLNSGSATINGLAPSSEILTTSGVGAITVTGFAATVDTGGSTLLNNLLHYYNFDESSGNLLDQVGSNSGTLVGPTQSVTGKVGNAYDFDGVNDYIDLTSDISLTGDFTFACWFEQDFAGDILLRTDPAFQHLAKMTGQTSWQFQNVEGTYNFNLSSMANNVWHLLVFTRSGTESRLYVDNVESTTGAVTMTGTWLLNRIGTNSGATWNGAIDELGIWDRVLSSAERDELWNSGSGITHPFT